VIELFEDVAPAAARHLLNRCTPGAGASLQGTLFHKLLAGFGLFGGKRLVICWRSWQACVCMCAGCHIGAVVVLSLDQSWLAALGWQYGGRAAGQQGSRVPCICAVTTCRTVAPEMQ
jgi:hypothetical protein